jgi:hypothetical protein
MNHLCRPYEWKYRETVMAGASFSEVIFQSKLSCPSIAANFSDSLDGSRLR